MNLCAYRLLKALSYFCFTNALQTYTSDGITVNKISEVVIRKQADPLLMNASEEGTPS